MKRKNLIMALSTVVVLSCGIFLGGCGADSSKPDVSITLDGKEIPMDGTVQECLDQGLITTDVFGEEQTYKGVFEARTASFETLHLGTSSEPHRSEVGVMLYNPESTSKTIKDCRIMKLFYDVSDDNSGQAPVLINGIDFWGMTQDEAIAALEEQGFSLSTNSLEEYHFLITTGSNSATITIDFETGDMFENPEAAAPQKKELSFDSSTYYVSEVKVDISSKLDFDFDN